MTTLRARPLGLPLSARFSPRPALVTLAALLFAAAIALVSLGFGSYALSLPEVLSILTGADHGFGNTVVWEWRLPRAVAGVVFGAALGLSGAVFQALTRNPLASPDVIGFASGSYTGALIVLLLTGGGAVAVGTGSLLGGVATALVVTALAGRGSAGGNGGFRLIIVGIGVSALLAAANTWLVLRADLEAAMSAAAWGAGSLNGITPGQLAVGAGTAAVALVAVAVLSAPLRQLELGEDGALARGVRVGPARTGLIVAGVALTAAVTAVAGPIAFVSLVAPQLAKRLARSPGIPLGASAGVGALLLSAADLAAQHALPTPIPVGLVTVVLGGGFLMWLLVQEVRR